MKINHKNNHNVKFYHSESETKSAENGIARFVPTKIPTCNIIPFNTPAYFLYF